MADFQASRISDFDDCLILFPDFDVARSFFLVTPSTQIGIDSDATVPIGLF